MRGEAKAPAGYARRHRPQQSCRGLLRSSRPATSSGASSRATSVPASDGGARSARRHRHRPRPCDSKRRCQLVIAVPPVGLRGDLAPPLSPTGGGQRQCWRRTTACRRGSGGSRQRVRQWRRRRSCADPVRRNPDEAQRLLQLLLLFFSTNPRRASARRDCR
jgi:hypothetical protein